MKRFALSKPLFLSLLTLIGSLLSGLMGGACRSTSIASDNQIIATPQKPVIATPQKPAALGMGVSRISEDKSGQAIGKSEKPDIVTQKAEKAGLPENVGDWKMVRYVPGEHGHFLYAQKDKSFSVFVTQIGSQKISTPKDWPRDWKEVVVERDKKVYLHHDSRDTNTSAVAWKHGPQRRMIVGHLEKEELLSLSGLLY